jgi:uncharacterized DUF497 family protein
MMAKLKFEWDPSKDAANQRKHGVSFEEAKQAFYDQKRLVAIDHTHSTNEEVRYYCFGMTLKGVMTVRYTNRGENIRIIGAGYWREGRYAYETRT